MRYRCHVGSVVVCGQTGLLDGVGRSPDTGCEFVTYVPARYRRQSKKKVVPDVTVKKPRDIRDRLHRWMFAIGSYCQLYNCGRTRFLFGTIYRIWSIDRENVSRPSEKGPG